MIFPTESRGVLHRTVLNLGSFPSHSTVVVPILKTLEGVVMKSLVMLLVLCASPCFAQDRFQLNTPSRYERYDSNAIALNRLMQQNRYSTNPPKIYSGDGQYLGELSANRHSPDSVSNPHGNYGSRHSYNSVNNPHGPYGQYRTQPIYVSPSRW